MPGGYLLLGGCGGAHGFWLVWAFWHGGLCLGVGEGGLVWVCLSL